MKAAIMFSGQGAQHPGMMRDIYEQFDAAKEVFDQASGLLGRDMRALAMDSIQEELDRTRNTQPCLLTCELAAFHVFRTLGLRYDAAMGFSLGEWAALAAAESVAEADVFKAIEKRADAMQRAVPAGEGCMVAVLGKDAQFVAGLCQSIGDIAPANYNCPGNITAAGTAQAGEKLLKAAEEQGVMATKVAISVPSHCVLMAPAAEELSPMIQAFAVREPKVEFIMNAVGKAVADPEQIKENLIKQLVSPVMFQQSVEYLLENDFDTFIEIGPGKTLSGMVKRTAKQAKKKVSVLSFNSLEGVEAVRELARTAQADGNG